MYTLEGLSKHRLFTYHVLRRGMHYHCPVTATYRFDLTQTLERITQMREAGQKVGLSAYIVKATALTLAAHKQLNVRLFHGLLGPRLATYEQVTCGMVTARQEESGENILIPLVIRNADKLSVEEIHALIKKNKSEPLSNVDGYQSLQKIKALPNFLIRFMHYLFRSHPRYTADKFSTYVVSTVITPGVTLAAVNNVSNQTLFQPLDIADDLVLNNGELGVRKMLSMGLTVDHYVVDGMAVQRAVLSLKKLLENPDEVLK